jgi:2-phospho-L-lactate/phosphoenolpyruvate guanylyltransferase
MSKAAGRTRHARESQQRATIDPMAAAQLWSIVVPVKRLTLAKSRLMPQASRSRSRLALAFAGDTVQAALACEMVRAVVAVTSDQDAAAELRQIGARVVADGPEAGLNPALEFGAQAAREDWPGHGVAALSADLPALRPAELGRALSIAAEHHRAFVADAGGSGTTLLSCLPRVELCPQFGPGSARRHLDSGAYLIEDAGLQSLRRDIDTAADLRAARLLGLGPRTSALLADTRAAS